MENGPRSGRWEACRSCRGGRAASQTVCAATAWRDGARTSAVRNDEVVRKPRAGSSGSRARATPSQVRRTPGWTWWSRMTAGRDAGARLLPGPQMAACRGGGGVDQAGNNGAAGGVGGRCRACVGGIVVEQAGDEASVVGGDPRAAGFPVHRKEKADVVPVTGNGREAGGAGPLFVAVEEKVEGAGGGDPAYRAHEGSAPSWRSVEGAMPKSAGASSSWRRRIMPMRA